MEHRLSRTGSWFEISATDGRVSRLKVTELARLGGLEPLLVRRGPTPGVGLQAGDPRRAPRVSGSRPPGRDG